MDLPLVQDTEWVWNNEPLEHLQPMRRWSHTWDDECRTSHGDLNLASREALIHSALDHFLKLRRKHGVVLGREARVEKDAYGFLYIENAIKIFANNTDIVDDLLRVKTVVR